MDQATHNKIVSFIWGIADADLRDTEQVPLLEEGGIEAFTRHFYRPQPLRTLAEISADILAVEKEAEGLLDGLLVEATPP